MGTKIDSEEKCGFLQKQLKDNHVLSRAEVADYCAFECKFQYLDVCKKSPFFWSFEDAVNQMMNSDLGEPQGFVEAFTINRAVYWEIMVHIVPILLTMVPMIVSYRFTNPRIVLFMILHAVFCIVYFGDDIVPMIINVLMAVICCFGVVRSKVINDYMVTFTVLFIQVVVVVASESVIINLLMGASVITLFVSQLINIVNSKETASKVFIIFYICQIIMSIDLLNKVIDGMFYDVFGLKILRVFLTAALPTGKYATLVSNVLSQCRIFAISFEEFRAFQVFVATFFGHIIIFAGLRACLGFMAMKHAKFGTDFALYGMGLYVYMIDLACPVFFAFGVLTGQEKVSGKRAWYCIGLGFLLVFELLHAADFVAARLVLSIFEYFVLQTGYGGVSELLNLDISDASGPFPTEGSMPFISVPKIGRLLRRVVNITVKTSFGGDTGARKKGIGYITGSNSGQCLILTARHVLDDGVEGSFSNSTYSGDFSTDGNSFITFGSGVDPVTGARTTFDASSVDEVGFIGKTDHGFISYLFMLNPTGAVALIYDFRLERNDLHVSVNLKPGDSGSPVFAVMRDGTIKFAGVISRGTFNTGTKNIVSCVIDGNWEGSPGHGENFEDFQEVLDETSKRNIKKVHDMLVEEHRIKEEWLVTHGADVDDLEGSEAEEGTNLFEDRRKAEDDDVKHDEQGDVRDGTRGKKKRKSTRKDQSFKKRLFAFKTLVELTFVGRDEHLREEFMQAFSDGKIIEFNRARSIPYGRVKGFVRPGLGSI